MEVVTRELLETLPSLKFDEVNKKIDINFQPEVIPNLIEDEIYPYTVTTHYDASRTYSDHYYRINNIFDDLPNGTFDYLVHIGGLDIVHDEDTKAAEMKVTPYCSSRDIYTITKENGEVKSIVKYASKTFVAAAHIRHKTLNPARVALGLILFEDKNHKAQAILVDNVANSGNDRAMVSSTTPAKLKVNIVFEKVHVERTILSQTAWTVKDRDELIIND